ncbi:divergent polysaccharide deacetylase family protein [Virgibacillus sp. LDC1]|nr:divergent polysaccharide deacetylase family protein [Virgibacillus sp. LDC1]
MRNVYKKSAILLCVIWILVNAGQIGYGAGVMRIPAAASHHQETKEMHKESGSSRHGQEAKVKKLAVIIDDFGNDQKGTQEMLNLPVKITVAVMPFLSTSVKDAEAAHRQGHDVIIHMPMEPKQGRSSWLGPGAILSSLTDEEIRKRMEEAIDSVPYAVGINNHMGSKVTGDERVMSIVLEVCRERGLFFIDSKTNYRSVVGKLAAEKGMPSIANDIFLDDVHTVQHVSKQLQTAAQHAEERTSCIAIGHVGKYGTRTAEALKGTIPKLQTKVEFVGISDLVREHSSWRPDPLRAH